MIGITTIPNPFPSTSVDGTPGKIARKNRPEKSPGKIARKNRPEKSPGKIARKNRPEKSPGKIVRKNRPEKSTLFLRNHIIQIEHHIRGNSQGR
jgi:hypothetical protein